MTGEIITSSLPNDADMIAALGDIACPVKLDTGDCIFSGLGEQGQNILVTIERKRLGDLRSCINTGRYLHQLQIAKENGADIFVLIVESGTIRSSPEDGMLEVLKWGTNRNTGHRAQVWEPVKPMMLYSRFDQFLTELDWLAGVIVKRSQDVQETAAIIKALYVQFQKTPDQHGSLHQIYKAPAPCVQLVRPSLVRRVACELDGVGWTRSQAVEAHFHSVSEMCAAGVKEWSELEGIGKKTAQKVVQSLGGCHG